jgi:hypothetical protein
MAAMLAASSSMRVFAPVLRTFAGETTSWLRGIMWIFMAVSFLVLRLVIKKGERGQRPISANSVGSL